MAEPTTIQCTTACTITVQHELTVPPFNLTVDEASQIGGAILLIWAIGFGARTIARTLNIAGRSGDEDV